MPWHLVLFMCGAYASNGARGVCNTAHYLGQGHATRNAKLECAELWDLEMDLYWYSLAAKRHNTLRGAQVPEPQDHSQRSIAITSRELAKSLARVVP